jgi:TolB-like protein/Tfp pilus assembly protein PilF
MISRCGCEADGVLYLFEDFALDTERRELRRKADLVQVEPQVFDLLIYLIRNRERVVSRDDLVAAVWNGRIVSEAALDSRVNAARRAIRDSGQEQRLIKTLPRKGVRFVGSVREQSPAATNALAPEQPADAGDQGQSAIPLPDRPSIAVLPFTNMSGDTEQEYFADGMSEEIITALSRCNWFFVIARNSSFTYKGKTVDIRQIGRELGVRYLLEGSVRRAGARLRITGQLIDATQGVQIWADRFDGDISDVFELQDRITESVVAAIEPKLQLAEIERLKHKPAANLDAYDLLLRAQQLEYEFTPESLTTALRYLERALALDPSYAPAMALAAYCYVEREFQGWSKDPEAESVEALRLAARAVELARDEANVLWMAAYTIRQLGKDPQRSRDLAYRSLHLNPNSAIALTIAAWTETALSQPDKALQLLQRAERLSPRDPRAWFMAAATSFAHFELGQYTEASECAKRAAAQNPRSAIVLRLLAASLAMVGERGQAAEVIKELLKIDPQLTIAKQRARLSFLPEAVWQSYAEGLRLAGLAQ